MGDRWDSAAANCAWGASGDRELPRGPSRQVAPALRCGPLRPASGPMRLGTRSRAASPFWGLYVGRLWAGLFQRIKIACHSVWEWQAVAVVVAAPRAILRPFGGFAGLFGDCITV